MQQLPSSPVIALDRDKYMVHEEVGRLLRACKANRAKSAPIYYLLFRVLAETGVRLASGLGVTPMDISLSPGEGPRIRVRWLKKRNPGHRMQELVISEDLYRLLARFSKGKDARKPLFRKGARGVGYAFKRFALLAGLNPKYSIHSLRHYHLMTWYKASGFDVESTRARAGHASISSTMIYVHTDPERTREIIGGLPRFA